MNKTSIFLQSSILGITAIALAYSPAVALSPPFTFALDVNGFSRPDDIFCAVDLDCALSRGGVSDVLTIYNGNGNIADRIFAFGNEETDNTYYFNPQGFAVDATQLGNFSTIIKQEFDYLFPGDNFGIFEINGDLVLGFQSDYQSNIFYGNISYQEEPGDNPYKYILEPGSRLTIPYDATLYLHPDLQLAGYTATFQSDYEVDN
ncbi:hypothetical protein [Aphanothece sacrum]|uniref:mRNA interferase n=1 Tax=Aphanothece sacrum FPU1 TaxID=1920663 RepID=A0A401IFW7_APHSA|nr:hypothetical protein [Aphanothece sacrum]GBF80185.1 mRNA interferase [Aphanothece sacrum FPU1]GBF85338.1 mRNA interferase [Aphanothece sacrum FPU3]